MSEARMYTKPFVLTTLAFFCFFTNVNAYNLLPLYLQALGARTGEIGSIMAMFSVADTSDPLAAKKADSSTGEETQMAGGAVLMGIEPESYHKLFDSIEMLDGDYLKPGDSCG